MIRKVLSTIGAAVVISAVAVGGAALADDSASPSVSPSASASASPSVKHRAASEGFTSNTVRVTNAQDEGHHGVWANLEFDRVVTATDNGDGTYAVTMTDDGSFLALSGAQSPRAGVDIAKGGKGTVHGTYAFTVTSATAPSSTGVSDSLNEGCDSAAGAARHCTNRPSNEAYVLRYFGDGATAKAGDYNWTYKTGCETWVDASSNNDGTDADAGDITMKNCPAPPVSDKVFSAHNVCRVLVTTKGYAVSKANVWTVTNNSDTEYKIHTAVTYNGKTVWFGWSNRGALAPHETLTVVSPYGGTLSVRLSGVTQDPAHDVRVNSNHKILCG